jgi:uncharacterized protein (TIGR02145 family)
MTTVPIGTQGSYTDPRDGKVYRTVVMPDGMEWLAENLNYNQPGSVFYNNDPAMGDLYGRLYTWQQAMDAVPEGWRLPTREEWAALVDAVGTTPGTKLKAVSPRWDGTDDFGFSALPGGRSEWGMFFNGGMDGYWWTSIILGPGAPSHAVAMLFNSVDFFWNIQFGMQSVRLIREPVPPPPSHLEFTIIKDGKEYQSVEGMVQILDLRDGTYDVTIKSHGFYDETTEITIAGEDKHFEFQLRPVQIPTIVKFNAEPHEIEQGEQVTLTWEVTGADTVEIDNGVGVVAAVGSVTLTLTDSTLYHLTAGNVAGSVVATAHVEVNEAVLGHWYMDGASPYVIRTAVELLEFAGIVNGTFMYDDAPVPRDSFEGKTVTLGADIDLNDLIENPFTGSWTDPRDGQTYRTVIMPDGKEWLAENLNFETSNSWLYPGQTPADRFGRLYTWDAAVTDAINGIGGGWRVATRGEWLALVTVVSTTTGTKLKATPPDWNGTDDFEFTALPGGNRNADGTFRDVGTGGYWWSATESNATSARGWGMDTDYDFVYENGYGKGIGFSVRLVRDVQTLNWVPIGNDANPFRGTFDGCEHIISNLNINRPTSAHQGLFGYVVSAIIMNVGVENINIEANVMAGGIVGEVHIPLNYISNILRCYTTGTVKTVRNYVGGIVGHNRGLNTVGDCFSTCYIYSGMPVEGPWGGEAGSAGVVGVGPCVVERCWASGDIDAPLVGNGHSGSIVGTNTGGGRIANCAGLSKRNTGSVSPWGYFGRIEGHGSTQFINNIAFAGMLDRDGTTNWGIAGLNTKNGADITAAEINADGTLGGRFTSENGWTTENGKLPGLFGKTVDMPEHLRVVEPVIAHFTGPTFVHTNTQVTLRWSVLNATTITIDNGIGSVASEGEITINSGTSTGIRTFTLTATNSLGTATSTIGIEVTGRVILTYQFKDFPRAHRAYFNAFVPVLNEDGRWIEGIMVIDSGTNISGATIRNRVMPGQVRVWSTTQPANPDSPWGWVSGPSPVLDVLLNDVPVNPNINYNFTEDTVFMVTVPLI